MNTINISVNFRFIFPTNYLNISSFGNDIVIIVNGSNNTKAVNANLPFSVHTEIISKDITIVAIIKNNMSIKFCFIIFIF